MNSAQGLRTLPLRPTAPPDCGMRLGRAEWLALLFALLLGHLFYARIVYYPSAFDAQNYLDIAKDIAGEGLLRKFFYSQIRTYGYPWLLSWVFRLLGPDTRWLGLIVFEAQLALYLCAAYALRRALCQWSFAAARFAFIGLALNFFVLVYAAETLTESISLSLIVFAAACFLWHLGANGKRLALSVIAGSLVVGFALMIRPANLFLLGSWLIMLPIVWRARRLALGRTVALAAGAAGALLLPMLPQIFINQTYYSVLTPLTSVPLGTNQMIWGIENLKYATALPPISHPSIFYANPLSQGSVVQGTGPLAWYLAHPVLGAQTLALHVFGMLDQDLLFTYSRNLDPWYRIPVGIANHAMVALALLGLLSLLRRAAVAALIPCRVGLAALACYALLHLAVHAPTLVEMRFGLPLLLAAGPFAAERANALWRSARAPRPAWKSWLFVLAYTAAALLLSHWIRLQSADIRLIG